MTPWKHAEISARKYGGAAKDYIEVHNWFDETKQYTGDWTHRALRHHAAGVEWCIDKFGHYIRNSDGKDVPVKVVAEQHVLDDCGFIPTVTDWLHELRVAPDDWMLRVPGEKVHAIPITE